MFIIHNVETLIIVFTNLGKEREKSMKIMKPWATDRPTAGMTGNNDAINVFFFKLSGQRKWASPCTACA